ncbi:hypothetical protein SAMN02799630_02579 [Paenibacillus sp. UNCCL117]|uniref:hypothetical protein n=1 Tax=unclassified Paenibacillus TaxID=185978 RepID=UPI000881EB4E|nr:MULTISPECIES: hypothetical protein [unclassified Paenibacillus]SDC06614.1 hypothetical protein SAMN04488602_101248 [Paenibacillus sp. cl123]SFW37857.1 hypothetical protein SAMN02799630_02579 [Paenibacillus sp. UNCCL117]
MLTIKLHPQLHNVVHELNSKGAPSQPNRVPADLSLSKEESSALIGTFTRIHIDGKKALTDRESDWG